MSRGGETIECLEAIMEDASRKRDFEDNGYDNYNKVQREQMHELR